MGHSIAFIADGVGRWARNNGMELCDGYRHACALLEKHIDALFLRDVDEVHVYAFSKYNLKRTEYEVRSALQAEYEMLLSLSAKPYGYKVIGEMDLFREVFPDLCTLRLEKDGDKTVFIYIGYSFEHYFDNYLDKERRPFKKIDMMIRTGGALCLSDFLPIELRYAQLYFFDTLFDDFSTDQVIELYERFRSTHYSYGK